MQGDTTRATPTSSGIAMLLNQSNMGIAMIARDWDDNITRPLLDLFVKWNMRFSEDDECKGDFEVIPKAASYLLVKDIKAQHLQVVTQMALNPAFAPYFHLDKLARKNVEMLDLDVDDLMKTADEIQAEMQQEQPPDPESIKAQAALKSAEARDKQAEALVQRAQMEASQAQQGRMLDHEEFRMKLEDHDRDRQMKAMVERLRFELAQMELVQSGQLAGEKLVSEREMAQLERGLGEFQAMLDARLKASKLAHDKQNLAAQVRLERPFRTE